MSRSVVAAAPGWIIWDAAYRRSAGTVVAWLAHDMGSTSVDLVPLVLLTDDRSGIPHGLSAEELAESGMQLSYGSPLVLDITEGA